MWDTRRLIGFIAVCEPNSACWQSSDRFSWSLPTGADGRLLMFHGGGWNLEAGPFVVVSRKRFMRWCVACGCWLSAYDLDTKQCSAINTRSTCEKLMFVLRMIRKPTLHVGSSRSRTQHSLFAVVPRWTYIKSYDHVLSVLCCPCKWADPPLPLSVIGVLTNIWRTFCITNNSESQQARGSNPWKL
jgi:hypothetical protein